VGRTGVRDHNIFAGTKKGRTAAHIGYLEASLFVSMRIAASLVFTALLTFSPAARAEKGPPLVVERGAGAERCPDEATLGTRVEQIRGRPATELPTAYRVTFTKTDEGFMATLRTGAGAGSVRTLEYDGAQCTALGNAVALTLALLFDSDIEQQRAASREPPRSPSTLATATSRPSSPPSPPPPREVTLSLGPAALFGVLRPLAPALTVEAGVALWPFRVSAGALFAWPQTTSLPPGTVQESLLSGFARACVAPWKNGALRFDACSGLFIGAITGEAAGYTLNERRTRTWIALPLEAALSGWSQPIGWELSLAALLPLRRSDFEVDGVGTAYHSPAVGGLLSLRIIGILPW
jgi:hypothetical protein